MGLGPYHPVRDLESALERGDLEMAIALSKDVAREHGRPIHIALALRLLALVATQRHEEYDRWARRWLVRWLSETLGATIEQAAEITGALADLPEEPRSVEAILEALR
jgi:hypothetical protein